MNLNIEKEYKILVTEQQFYELLKHYPGVSFHLQKNTYFDTIDGQIRAQKGAMRIRKLNDNFIFTLKMPDSDGLKEYECNVNDDSLHTIQTNPEIAALLSHYHINGELCELCSLITYRAIVETDHAELCFDISKYGPYQDFEIEYEWKKEHDGLTAFQNILKPIQLRYTTNCESKIKRAIDALCR